MKGSPLTPKTAFIIAAIDKEIRLSFAKRIRETLPKEYHHLITEGKFKDSPDYKYNNDSMVTLSEPDETSTNAKQRPPMLKKAARSTSS